MPPWRPGAVFRTKPEAPLAAFARGRLAMEIGHYGLAETALERAGRAGGDLADEARRLLAGSTG